MSCVSTRCVGVEEVIGKRNISKCGDKKAILDAIFSLIENEVLRKNFSKSANERAKDFSFDMVIDKWEQVIES